MRVYIAGPMTGLPKFNYPAFRAAANRLRSIGVTVVSPVEIAEKYGAPEEVSADPSKLADLIIEELDALGTCDAIYLLPGWQRSVGARRELYLALSRKLEIIVPGSEGGMTRASVG